MPRFSLEIQAFTPGLALRVFTAMPWNLAFSICSGVCMSFMPQLNYRNCIGLNLFFVAKSQPEGAIMGLQPRAIAAIGLFLSFAAFGQEALKTPSPSAKTLAAETQVLPNAATGDAQKPEAAIDQAQPQIPQSIAILNKPFREPSEAREGALSRREGLCREEWPSLSKYARLVMHVDLAPALPFDCPLLNVRIGGEMGYFPAEECMLFPPGSPLGRKDRMLVRMGSMKILLSPRTSGSDGVVSYDSVNFPGKSVRRDGERFVYEDRVDDLKCAFSSVDAGETWRLDSIGSLKAPAMNFACEWSSDGALKALRLPGGEAWTFKSKDGLPVSIADPWGATTELSWNEASRLKSLKTSLPSTHPLYPKPAPGRSAAVKPKPLIIRDIHVESDAEGRALSLVNSFGEKFAAEYRADSDSKTGGKMELAIVLFPDGTKRFAKRQWKSGRSSSSELEEGVVWRDEKGVEHFDAAKRTSFEVKSSVVVPVSVKEGAKETKFSYEAGPATPSKTVRPDGSVSVQEKDKSGMPLGESSGAGKAPEKKYAYDKAGRLSEVAAGGAKRKMNYEGDAKMPSSIESGEISVSWKYDSLGRPVEAVTKAGESHGFDWDFLCRMTLHTLPDGSSIRYEYRAGLRAPSMIERTAPNGKKSEEYFEFDPWGRLTRSESADGSWKEWLYQGGDIVRRTESGEPKKVFKMSYDAAHRKSMEQGPDYKLNYAYDQKGRLLRETNRAGKATAYEYNSDGSLAKKSFADGKWESYSYDASGRLVRKDFSDGSWETLSYYPDGGLAKTMKSDGSGTEYIKNPLDNSFTCRWIKPAAAQAKPDGSN